MTFRKLQTKILAGYILIVFIFSAIAGVSYFQLKAMEEKVNELTNVEFAFYEINQKLAFNLAERASNGRAYMLYGKPDYVKAFDELTNESIELEEELLQMSDQDADKELVARSSAWGKKVRNELFSAVDRGNPDEITRIGAEIAPETKALVQINKDMAETRGQNIADIKKEVEKQQTTIITILFISTGVAIILAFILGFVLARSITKPIIQLAGISERIAEGDLDVDVDVESKDEIGTLAKAFKTMTDNLNEVMTTINAAAEQVASGSKQVSDSSMALSQGATEQASSIEQLTASLEEISSQTRNNAQNANEANTLAEDAKGHAIHGNEQMKEMLGAMDEINDASNNISKIIKVIDEIAFQTNILALNAAVEAARAGQHGKGFAVVAEEVRNLAARSANAAKETTDMIEGSMKKVEGGTKIANQTADALNRIVEGIAKVANLVNDIAVASNEQASGINQINQGISQVAEVVQTNSATSEEGAAASEELASQAELLKEQISRFKIRKSRQSNSYKSYEDINPEVLKMLENMNGKRKIKSTANEHNGEGTKDIEEKPKSTKKIALSDNEFGKY